MQCIYATYKCMHAVYTMYILYSLYSHFHAYGTTCHLSYLSLSAEPTSIPTAAHAIDIISVAVLI